MRGAALHSDLLRSSRAPAPRTLLDILDATTTAHPEAVAIDDGDRRLTYRELRVAVDAVADRLHGAGVPRSARVGIRMPSGSRELYVSILGILAAGCAYVPVDADDPDERAALVFGEADVAAVLTGEGLSLNDSHNTGIARAVGNSAASARPGLEDDAWIIFTSGSAGAPKGVAVRHRNAAAFVDAEAALFLAGKRGLGPGDRVLAGLSVAFDASCEEMWLAWRHGATLVPAPRSLVRTGADLGPWLAAREITVVSTVPTLASLWPDDALADVRLLIFGGEACPPELVERLWRPDRELWNTYGPTEATVVACAAQMHPGEPVRIGLPLNGWDLAVVDAEGEPVPDGATGELVIGGVGLARYLDPVKDAQKYAPLASLGWDRAYRSGDIVRNDPAGLFFVGRADDQVKIGGRRIELGEIEAALQQLPGVGAATVAVRKTMSGNAILVGYLVRGDEPLDLSAAHEQLTRELPAAMVPRLAEVPELPVRTSGKVDKDKLPWPLPTDAPAGGHGDDAPSSESQRWLAGQFEAVLGTRPTDLGMDFFELGGGSLTAAQLVTGLRSRYPQLAVADLYANPTVGELDAFLRAQAPAAAESQRMVRPVPRRAQALQLLGVAVLAAVSAVQWLTWFALAATAASAVFDIEWLPRAAPLPLVVAVLIFVTPAGRLPFAAAMIRAVTAGIEPGTYPRGSVVHVRLWFATRLLEVSHAASLSTAPFMVSFARALGSRIGRGVDLHTLPPVTGMLTLEDDVSVEPEVDLSGLWVDGDLVHVGTVHVEAGAAIGARSVLAPGAHVGSDAIVAPGSAVFGKLKGDRSWSGSPAARVRKTTAVWPKELPSAHRAWAVIYGITALLLAALPLISLGAGLALVAAAVAPADSLPAAIPRVLIAIIPATILVFGLLMTLTAATVRVLSLGLDAGTFPVRSRRGWQVWATLRILDSARTFLFPLYAGQLTPLWLRVLGAKIGKDVEASTVLLLPKFSTVGDGAFLADDTWLAPYELRHGWMHVQHVKVGKRAFLGNSGMASPGRRIPKRGLVAVLSSAPAKAKAGTSWLGSPPQKLRRAAQDASSERTYAPTFGLKVARAGWETLRLLAPAATYLAGLGLFGGFTALVHFGGWGVATLLAPVCVLAVAVIAAAVTSAAKWLFSGRIDDGEHPLWSAFVWRNEVADTFTETLATTWFIPLTVATPALNTWMRTMGASIGRGVWLESYWLPEADLVELGDGATVERGCVVQTHLFHDRVMSLDAVVLEPGATLGPHGVILPGARIGTGATVGPSSLVLRGDQVPAGSRWQGNPVAPESER